MNNKKKVMNVEETARRLKSLREGKDKKVKTKELSHFKLAEALIEEYKLDVAPESLKASLINYEQSEEFDDKGLRNNNYGKNAGMATKTLFMLADFYGVSTDYLLGISDFPSVDEDLQKVHKLTDLSKEEIEILKEWVKLDKEAIEEYSHHSIFRDLLDIIKLLIKNEPKYHFLKNMASFLFFDRRHKDLIERKEKIIDEKTGIECSIDMLSKLAKFEIDEILYRMKEDIEEV